MTVKIDLKKKNLDEKPSRKKLIIIIIISVLLITGIVLGLVYSNLSDRFNLKFSPLELFSSNPQLKKDSTETYTNVLILGVDTRDDNPGLRNTDTIILLSLNHKTNQAILISIPRDFFVQVPNQGWYTKINGIYAVAENGEKGAGIPAIQGVVEDITNTEIQYYGMVDLTAFSHIIDTLDTIEVDVENSFTDYRFPVEGRESQYQTVSFTEGLQTMNSVDALRFVRSRHSLDNNEGSDFARARRQQRVLEAIKKEILSSETLLNPKKVFEIIKILEKNIEHSEISNRDIQAVNHILKNKEIKIYSFVLDPSLANYKLITDRGLSTNAYAIGPVPGLENYSDLHTYLEYAFKYPKIYSNEPVIRVYDVGLGYEQSVAKTEELKSKLPYTDILFSGTLLDNYEGEYLFDNVKKDSIIKDISKRLKMKTTEKPEFVQNLILNGEYIILLGSEEQND